MLKSVNHRTIPRSEAKEIVTFGHPRLRPAAAITCEYYARAGPISPPHGALQELQTVICQVLLRHQDVGNGHDVIFVDLPNPITGIPGVKTHLDNKL